MDEIVTQLFTDYNDLIWLLFGFILVIGSRQNWDWLCDPTGKPQMKSSPNYSQTITTSYGCCSASFLSLVRAKIGIGCVIQPGSLMRH